jgi:hypothetical protein
LSSGLQAALWPLLQAATLGRSRIQRRKRRARQLDRLVVLGDAAPATGRLTVGNATMSTQSD